MSIHGHPSQASIRRRASAITGTVSSVIAAAGENMMAAVKGTANGEMMISKSAVRGIKIIKS
jgi:hypothetical protein